jgi:hypothetical protein
LFDEKQKAIDYLNNLSLDDKYLSKSLTTISKYYKYIGLSKERTTDLLLDWLKKQNCNMEFNVVISTLDKIINNVYNKNYIFIHDIKVDIYKNEINYIKTLKSKGEKKVALSLIYLSKIYGNNFYCYHLTLHKLTGLSIRHIKRIIKKLNSINFIDIVDRDRTKKILVKDGVTLKRYSHPNTYNIKIIGEDEVLFSCGDIENIDDIFRLII